MSGGFRGAKEGGLMAAKAYKEGGLAYATGGDIKMMRTDQLEALLEKPGLTPLEVGMIEEQLILRRRMAMNPQTDAIMAQALGRSGIASIGTGDMVSEEMAAGAGGGIVAFAGKNESLVKDGVDNIKDASNKSFRDRLEAELFESLQRQKTIDPFKESKAEEAEIRAEMKENKRIAPYRALAMTGLRAMTGTSQDPLSNFGLGGIEGLKSYAQSMREQDDARKLLLLQGGEREKSSFGREAQRQNVLAQTIGRIDSRADARAAAGAGVEDRALTRVMAMINQDDQIPALIKQRDLLDPRDPNYQKYNNAINGIKEAYFKQANIKRPFVPSPGVQLDPEPEKKGFFSGLFGGNKPVQTKNELVPFNKLPTPS